MFSCFDWTNPAETREKEKIFWLKIMIVPIYLPVFPPFCWAEDVFAGVDEDGVDVGGGVFSEERKTYQEIPL